MKIKKIVSAHIPNLTEMKKLKKKLERNLNLINLPRDILSPKNPNYPRI